MKLSIHLNPERIIILTFLSAIGLGAVGLKMPFALQEGKSLPWIDAIFMAASAVCVTGLGTVDVGGYFTFWGQIVLLTLMQIGGLGIMTFSLLFALFFRIRTSLTSRLSISSLSRKVDSKTVGKALKIIFLSTILVEGIGASLLYIRFQQIYPPEFALFASVFHAVSAFCNCGLSLFPDNLMSFQDEFFVPIVVMCLIVLGGIGFVIIDEFVDYIRARYFLKRRILLSLHSKICLVGTAFLIIAGALFLWVFERYNDLLGLSPLQQIVNAVFLSVTARTAGLNMIDTNLLTNASLFFLVFLMFIGGCSGSTAGGVKVGTFAIVMAFFKGKMHRLNSTSIFKRKIPSALEDKAFAIFAAAFVILFWGILFLQVTESGDSFSAKDHHTFLSLLFEATSALGTVGLSAGVTPILSKAGKMIIIVLMFLGRVGPLTLGISLVRRKMKTTQFEYVEEDVIIG